MTDIEKEDLKRRDLLRKLAGVIVAAPALKVLAACSDDGARPQAFAPSPVTQTPGAGGSPAPTTAAAGNAASSTTPPVKTPPVAQTPPTTPGSTPASTPPSTPMTTTPAPVAGSTGSAGAGGSGSMPAGGAADSVDIDSLACVLSPQMTEGPFFVDEKLERSDLLEGESEASVTSGTPLELTLGVYQVAGDKCMALAGVQLDIWHADTQGVYSDEGGGMSSFIQPQNTMGKKFLRGYQITDESGIAKFKTIVPGFYGSRALHIHFKVRMKGAANSRQVYTSQFFFDDALGDKVLADAAYKQGNRIKNRMDQVFTNTGSGGAPSTMPPPAGKKVVGDDMVLDLKPLASGKGYAATFRIGVEKVT